MLALRFTAETPDLVNRLVLVDGWPALYMQVATAGSYESFVRPLGLDTINEAKALLRQRYASQSDDWLERQVKQTMMQNWGSKWVYRHDPELYWILESGSQSQEDDQRLWEMVASIHCRS